MKFYRSEYKAGGTAIIAYTDEGEPFGNVSICLAEYGLVPPDDFIVINHDMLVTGAYEKYIKPELVKSEISEISYGYAESVIVRLIDGWQEKCKEM